MSEDARADARLGSAPLPRTFPRTVLQIAPLRTRVLRSLSGDVDPGPGVFACYPAISTNRCGDGALVMTTSAVTTTPEISVTGRRADNPPGFMAAPTTRFSSPSGASGYWGAYFGMAVDPVDDTTFWFVGEYQDVDGWGPWIGSIRVSCPGDLNCDGFVDGIDYDTFQNAFEPGDPAADYNRDGFVDGIDYDRFNNDFEGGC